MSTTPTFTYEIEFTPGGWSNVTADVDMGAGHQIHVGRTTGRGQPQPSTATITLRNPLGKYTPGLQVLTDGTAAPFYPNVAVRRRLRISNQAGVRFLGYVKSWAPQTNGFAGSAMCTVTASDRMDALSRITMDANMETEVTPDLPAYYWPLTDGAGATAAAEKSGGAPLVFAGGTVGPVTFGDNGPGAGDGTGVLFAPSGASTGQVLRVQRLSIAAAPFTVEVWVNAGLALPTWATGGGNENILGLDDTLGGWMLLYLLGGIPTFRDSAGVISAAASLADGGWHHLVVTRVAGGNNTLYVDGVSAGTSTASAGGVEGYITLGDVVHAAGGVPAGRFQGNVGQLALYPSVLPTARITAHFNAGRGWAGETCSTRIARFLGYAGLTSADWTLDTSTVTLGTYPHVGKDILSGCQDMAVTEGGDSAFYVLAGTMRFTSRTYRKPGPPVLTLDATADVDRGAYQPVLDDQNLANSSTASRSTESGVQSTQTVTDAARIAVDGLATDDVTTYTSTDLDALNLAQSIVAESRAPAFRLPQITLDLRTAEHDLYAAAQAVQIGSRLRATNLPAGSGPATQLDLIVEGWTETAARDSYLVAFDTSPADAPARMTLTPAATRTNLCVNPSMETNTTGWSALSSTLARDTTAFSVGAASLKVTVAASTVNGGVTSTALIPATVGLTYALQVRVSVPVTLSGTYSVYIEWLTSTPTVISDVVIGTLHASTSGFVTISGTSVAPPTATQARIFVRNLGANNAAQDIFNLDAVLFEQSGTVGTYFDGATADTTALAYGWTGTVNNSTSTLLTPTYSRLQADRLFLASAITNAATSVVVTGGRTNILVNPSFETNTNGWSGNVFGYTAATIARSTAQSYVPAGGYGAVASLLTTWPDTTAGHSAAGISVAGLTVGVTYTFSIYVYVPTGSPAVRVQELFSTWGTWSTVVDRWQRMSITKTATATAHAFGVVNVTPSTAGQTVYLDAAMLEVSATVNPYLEGTVAGTSKMFTTDVTRYPMDIKLAAEVVTLNTAPGATDPQTFTGVTRAVSGTVAAAQGAGTTVDLFPASALTL